VTPPGIVDSEQQQVITEYLQSGGSLYIEGANLGNNHTETVMFDMFGTSYLGDGNENGISAVYGVSGSSAESMQFGFQFDTDADYSIDEFAVTMGNLLLTDQEGIGRAVQYDEGNYKVITSSIIFSSLIDTEIGTKSELMLRYLEFLADYSVGIDSDDTASEAVVLNGNYPNPFNPTTTIEFSLNSDQYVELYIFNLKGQKIKSLLQGEMPSGIHHIAWTGENSSGKKVSSGVYLYQLKAGTYTSTKKMLLLK